MSRLFDISWTDEGFLMVFAFIGPIIYTITALDLFWKQPFAGFVACFTFIGPGVAEFTHFLFPLIEPSIEPANPASLSTTVSNGVRMAQMPNYFIGTTGHYYFPGLYTAILPMIPGIYGIWSSVRAARQLDPARAQPAKSGESDTVSSNASKTTDKY